MTFFLLKFSICFQHYINNVFNKYFKYSCTNVLFYISCSIKNIAYVTNTGYILIM